MQATTSIAIRPINRQQEILRSANVLVFVDGREIPVRYDSAASAFVADVIEEAIADSRVWMKITHPGYAPEGPMPVTMGRPWREAAGAAPAYRIMLELGSERGAIPFGSTELPYVVYHRFIAVMGATPDHHLLREVAQRSDVEEVLQIKDNTLIRMRADLPKENVDLLRILRADSATALSGPAIRIVEPHRPTYGLLNPIALTNHLYVRFRSYDDADRVMREHGLKGTLIEGLIYGVEADPGTGEGIVDLARRLMESDGVEKVETIVASGPPSYDER